MAELRIGAFISGGGSNLQAIIDGCETGEIDGRMVFVGADTPAARGLERAAKHGIPSFVVDYSRVIGSYRQDPSSVDFPADADPDALVRKQHFFPAGTPTQKVRAFLATRAAAEAELLTHMTRYPFDLLVLAGFMRNLSPYFIDKVNTDPGRPRIMNIHPALLPAFPGVDGYGDTFRYGCKVGGCTVHFIDYGEDSGPIIGQKCFDITGADTLDTVKEKGLRLEWQLYPECVQLYARNRLAVERNVGSLPDGKTVQRDIVIIKPPG